MMVCCHHLLGRIVTISSLCAIAHVLATDQDQVLPDSSAVTNGESAGSYETEISLTAPEDYVCVESLSNTDRYRAVFKLFQAAEERLFDSFRNTLSRHITCDSSSVPDPSASESITDESSIVRDPNSALSEILQYCEYYHAEYDPKIDNLDSKITFGSLLAFESELNGSKDNNIRARLSDDFYEIFAEATADERCLILRALFEHLGLRPYAISTVVNRCLPFIVSDLHPLLPHNVDLVKEYLRSAFPSTRQHDKALIQAAAEIYGKPYPISIATAMLLLESDDDFPECIQDWAEERLIQQRAEDDNLTLREHIEKNLNHLSADFGESFLARDDYWEMFHLTAMLIASDVHSVSSKSDNSYLNRSLKWILQLTDVFLEPPIMRRSDYGCLVSRASPSIAVMVRSFASVHENIIESALFTDFCTAALHSISVDQQKAFLSFVDKVMGYAHLRISDRFEAFDFIMHRRRFREHFSGDTRTSIVSETPIGNLFFDVVLMGLPNDDIIEFCLGMEQWYKHFGKTAFIARMIAELAGYAARRNVTWDIITAFTRGAARKPSNRIRYDLFVMELLCYSPKPILAESCALPKVLTIMQSDTVPEGLCGSVLNRFDFQALCLTLQERLSKGDDDDSHTLFGKVLCLWEDTDQRRSLCMLAFDIILKDYDWKTESELLLELVDLNRFRWFVWFLKEHLPHIRLHTLLALICCLHGKHHYLHENDYLDLMNITASNCRLIEYTGFGPVTREKFLHAARFLIQLESYHPESVIRDSPFYKEWIQSLHYSDTISFCISGLLADMDVLDPDGAQYRLCRDLVRFAAAKHPDQVIEGICSSSVPSATAIALLEVALLVIFPDSPRRPDTDLASHLAHLWSRTDSVSRPLLEAVLIHIPLGANSAHSCRQIQLLLSICIKAPVSETFDRGVLDWVRKTRLSDDGVNSADRPDLLHLLSTLVDLIDEFRSEMKSESPNCSSTGCKTLYNHRCGRTLELFRKAFRHLLHLAESNCDSYEEAESDYGSEPWTKRQSRLCEVVVRSPNGHETLNEALDCEKCILDICPELLHAQNLISPIQAPPNNDDSRPELVQAEDRISPQPARRTTAKSFFVKWIGACFRGRTEKP